MIDSVSRSQCVHANGFIVLKLVATTLGEIRSTLFRYFACSVNSALGVHHCAPYMVWVMVCLRDHTFFNSQLRFRPTIFFIPYQKQTYFFSAVERETIFSSFISFILCYCVEYIYNRTA